jgi:hypothetical protein
MAAVPVEPPAVAPAAQSVPVTSTPLAASAKVCDIIAAANPDAILGPTPVVVGENPGRMCKLAATDLKEAAAIRLAIEPARDIRAREQLMREYARERSSATTMREEPGLGEKAIVRIDGNGRFVRYFVLRGDRTLDVEFWQVTPHDAARARAITGRIVDQFP